MTSTRRDFVSDLLHPQRPMTPIVLRRALRPLTIVSALAVLVVAASACLDDSITGVRELSLVLTSDRTIVSAGDSVNLEYSAEGTGLAFVYLEYGDGGVDTVSFSGGFEEPDEELAEYFNADTLFYKGPIEAAGTLTHAFNSAGTFLVIGYAVGVDGVASDTVTLTVN